MPPTVLHLRSLSLVSLLPSRSRINGTCRTLVLGFSAGFTIVLTISVLLRTFTPSPSLDILSEAPHSNIPPRSTAKNIINNNNNKNNNSSVSSVGDSAQYASPPSSLIALTEAFRERWNRLGLFQASSLANDRPMENSPSRGFSHAGEYPKGVHVLWKTGSSQVKAPCFGDQEFRNLMPSCLHLQSLYDKLNAKAQAVYANPSHVAILIAGMQKLTERLESQCGVPRRRLELRSLDRVRYKEMNERCASSVEKGHEPCGSCGALLDMDAVERRAAEGLPPPFHPAEAQTGEGRGSGVLAAWGVWRKGPGFNLGVGLPLECTSESASEEETAGSVQILGNDTFGYTWTETETKARTLFKNVSKAVGHSQSTKYKAKISVLLQYFMQPEHLATVVESFARCSPGLPKDPNPDWNSKAGVEMDMLANVDQPGESTLWVEQWRKWNFGSGTDGADSAGEGQDALIEEASRARGNDFLLVMFSHNLHEVRGYGALARMSTGDILMLTQDDDKSAPNCRYAERVVHAAWQHPLTVSVAQWGVCKYGINLHGNSAYMTSFGNVMELDPVTGFVSDFAEYIDVGPMFIVKCNWLQLGGFDWNYGGRGQSGIYDDWDFAFRQWEAGYRIMAVQIAQGLHKQGVGEALTHNPMSLSGIYRALNSGWNGWVLGADGVPQRSENSYAEVNRVTRLMYPFMWGIVA